MAIRFIKIAAIDFVIGADLGIYMGGSDRFSFTSAHAHINLLGWVSLALAGLIHRAFPQAGRSGLAAAHYWLKMIGVPLDHRHDPVRSGEIRPGRSLERCRRSHRDARSRAVCRQHPEKSTAKRLIQ